MLKSLARVVSKLSGPAQSPRVLLVIASVVVLVALAWLKWREPFASTDAPVTDPTAAEAPAAAEKPVRRRPRGASGGNKITRRCDDANDWHKPRTKREFAMLRQLRARAKEFLAHLQATYPTDQRTLNLAQRWNKNVDFTDKETGASYAGRNGCLVINPYYETKTASGERAELLAQLKTPGTKPGMDDLGRLLSRLLYMMAFTTDGVGRDAAFFETYRWFLRVASEELSWPVVVNCKACCLLTTPCTKEAVCPSCRWLREPEACTADEAQCTED